MLSKYCSTYTHWHAYNFFSKLFPSFFFLSITITLSFWSWLRDICRREDWGVNWLGKINLVLADWLTVAYINFTSSSGPLITQLQDNISRLTCTQWSPVYEILVPPLLYIYCMCTSLWDGSGLGANWMTPLKRQRRYILLKGLLLVISNKKQPIMLCYLINNKYLNSHVCPSRKLKTLSPQPQDEGLIVFKASLSWINLNLLFVDKMHPLVKPCNMTISCHCILTL